MENHTSIKLFESKRIRNIGTKPKKNGISR
jgi:hypothetical protein